MGLDTKQLTPRTVLGRISWAKNHMVDPQEYYLAPRIRTASASPTSSGLRKAELRKNNALDFDDLLLEAVRLLKVSSEARERYQRRYRYLLVDEYQDTNRPQYELMKLLAGEAQERLRRGRRGPEHLLLARRRHPQHSRVREGFSQRPHRPLEQNYRSTQIILEGRGAVVANNLRRKGKKLWTDRQGGSLIGYYEAPDGENEALFIADRIQKFLREAESATGRARRSALRRALSHQLAVAAGGGGAAPLQHPLHHGRRLQLLRARRDQGPARLPALVRNPHDSMALQRVINTPARGIGKTTLETLERLALETGSPPGTPWRRHRQSPHPQPRADGHRVLPPAHSRRPGHDGPRLCRQALGDVAAERGGGADTGFEFGAATDRRQRPAPIRNRTSTSAAARTSFRLLDASSFSPFAASQTRPGFCHAQAETWEPQLPTPI
jgi:DNA helicase II / ATP-dependent DNA helicase PcrA